MKEGYLFCSEEGKKKFQKAALYTYTSKESSWILDWLINWYLLTKHIIRVWVTLKSHFLSVLKAYLLCVLRGTTACKWRMKENLPVLDLSSYLVGLGDSIQVVGLSGRLSWAILLAPKSHCLNRLKSKGLKADSFSCTEHQRIFGGKDRAWLYIRAATRKNMGISDRRKY